jgi:hypothetical protein
MKLSKTIALFFTSFIATNVFACSCGPLDLNRMESGSPVIFSGVMVKKINVRSTSMVSYTFTPSRMYKGELQKSVEVITEKYSAACGQQFKPKKEYVILAYEEEGKLHTDICSSWEKEGYQSSQTQKLEEYMSRKQ